MAKYCPIYKIKVVYLDCLECEDKQCKKKNNEGKKKPRNATS